MVDVQCPGCRVVVAHEVDIGGLVLLQVGGLLLREFHGVCVSCGRQIHYSIPDKVILALLRQPQVSAILHTTE